MPDGTLLHLRDTYPVETAWAPPHVGDELRQARAAAWQAHLDAARAGAEADAAGRSGRSDAAARHRVLAASYRALHDAYRERDSVLAGVMADRADWETATRAQRHLAVAADAELRRRHPRQQFTPLRSAEPQAAAGIEDVAAGRRAFARQLAGRQSLMIPAEDPRYGDLGQAFPSWAAPGTDAILQPPKPEIRPSARILERAADRDADREAGE
jgi:hypothetical protein